MAEPIKMPFALRTRMGPRNIPCIRWGSIFLYAKWQFWGRKARPIVKYGDFLSCLVQKLLNRSRCHLVCDSGGPKKGVLDVRWACTLAAPGVHNWTVNVRRQCSLVSYYFDHSWLIFICHQYFAYFFNAVAQSLKKQVLTSGPCH